MMNAKMFNQEYSERFSKIVNRLKSSAAEAMSKINNAQYSRKIALDSQIFRTQMAIYKARRKGFSEVTLYLEGLAWYRECFEHFTKLGYDVMETNGGYVESEDMNLSPAVTISWRTGSSKEGSLVHFDTKSLYDCCNAILDISDSLGDGGDTNYSDDNLS